MKNLSFAAAIIAAAFHPVMTVSAPDWPIYNYSRYLPRSRGSVHIKGNRTKRRRLQAAFACM